jgi:hypothetical protein
MGLATPRVLQFCPWLAPKQPQYWLLVAALTHVGIPLIVHITSVAGQEQLPAVHADPGVFEQFAPTEPVGP